MSSKPRGAQDLVQSLQKWYDAFTAFLGENGWTLLFLLLAAYLLKQRVDPWLEERRQARILQEAQRKERVEVLDQDKRRVRERQIKAMEAKGGKGK